MPHEPIPPTSVARGFRPSKIQPSQGLHETACFVTIVSYQMEIIHSVDSLRNMCKCPSASGRSYAVEQLVTNVLSLPYAGECLARLSHQGSIADSLSTLVQYVHGDLPMTAQNKQNNAVYIQQHSSRLAKVSLRVSLTWRPTKSNLATVPSLMHCLHTLPQG